MKPKRSKWNNPPKKGQAIRLDGAWFIPVPRVEFTQEDCDEQLTLMVTLLKALGATEKLIVDSMEALTTTWHMENDPIPDDEIDKWVAVGENTATI